MIPRKVSQEDAQKLSAELGLKYIEVSAKLGRNIDFLFKSIVA